MAKQPSNLPLISVIVPCYNGADYLADMMDSVAKQTYPNWECIIVNDGSTDSSSTILTELCQTYTSFPFHVISTPNFGVDSARNTAIQHAKGDFLFPLDCDDCLAPTALQDMQLVFQKDSSIDAVFCGIKYFGEKWEFENLNSLTTELILEHGLYVSALYRRSIWDTVGGYKPCMVLGNEDWEFWVNAFCTHSFRFFGVPKPLLFYQSHTHSRSRTSIENQGVIKAQLRLLHPKAYPQHQQSRAISIVSQSNVFRSALDTQSKKTPQDPSILFFLSLLDDNPLTFPLSSPFPPIQTISIIVSVPDPKMPFLPAIQSILAQPSSGLKDLVILVPDTHQDSLCSQLESLSHSDILSVVPTQENKISDTLNTLIPKLTGDLVVFHPDHSIVSPHYVDQICAACPCDPYSVLIIPIHLDPQLPSSDYHSWYPFCITSISNFSFLEDDHLLFSTSCFGIRRSFLLAAPFISGFDPQFWIAWCLHYRLLYPISFLSPRQGHLVQYCIPSFEALLTSIYTRSYANALIFLTYFELSLTIEYPVTTSFLAKSHIAHLTPHLPSLVSHLQSYETDHLLSCSISDFDPQQIIHYSIKKKRSASLCSFLKNDTLTSYFIPNSSPHESLYLHHQTPINIVSYRKQGYEICALYMKAQAYLSVQTQQPLSDGLLSALALFSNVFTPSSSSPPISPLNSTHFLSPSTALSRPEIMIFLDHSPLSPSFLYSYYGQLFFTLLSSLQSMGLSVSLCLTPLCTGPWPLRDLIPLSDRYTTSYHLYQGTINDAKFLSYSCLPTQDRSQFLFSCPPDLNHFLSSIMSDYKPQRLLSFATYIDPWTSLSDTNSAASLPSLFSWALFNTTFHQKAQQHLDITGDIDLSFIDPHFYHDVLFGFDRQFRSQNLDYMVTSSSHAHRLLSEQNPNICVHRTVLFPSVSPVNNTYTGAPIIVMGPDILNLQGYYFFATKILPFIRKKYPDFKVLVVGSGTSTLQSIPGIELVGPVSDLSPYYQQAPFSICPKLVSPHTPWKILESMAYAVPALAFDTVIDLPDIQSQHNAVLVENSAAFIASIQDLHSDQKLCRKLGQNAHDTAMSYRPNFAALTTF